MTASAVCPVCSGSKTRIYLEGEDRNLDVSEVGSSRVRLSHGTILRCRGCSFGFRRFRPGEEELRELYQEADDQTYEAQMRGRWKTAGRHLRIVERYSSRGRLLDVGCASGAFLWLAAGSGWEAVGIEPSRSQYARARKLLDGRVELQNCTLHQASLPALFDVITVWDVLEHVPEPVEFLQRCVSSLRPGGRLFVNVPDLDSLQARVLGRHWPLLLAEHLNYFNRSSLQLCGRRAGLAWLESGRRPASFSAEYAVYRLAQHGIPVMAFAYSIARRLPLAKVVLPLPMGELYAVLAKN